MTTPAPPNLYAGHTGPLRAVAVTPDMARIVAGGQDGTARVWDRLTGVPGRTLAGHTGPVEALAVTPDGTQIVTGAQDGTARLWDRHTGELVSTLRHSGPVHAVAITPDGTQIVTGAQDGTARVWDRHTEELVGALIGHSGPVHAVAVTPDGTQIITGAQDGTARVWDRHTDQLIRTLAPCAGGVRALAVTPDGSRILSGGQNAATQIWDRATGAPVAMLTGHTGPVQALAVTPDGAQIITGGGQDGAAEIWDRATGAPVITLTGHTGAVQAVAVTADGTQIITGGQDGGIRIWDRISGVPIAGTGIGAVPRATVLPEVTSDAESPDDRLDIRADVRTVAALVASQNTLPPLSIALLGDWGAGKSTFMRQVCDHIDHLADLSRHGPGLSLFAANVRQIRFNAWHYSDDTVWVGLVEHLFHTLADSDPARPASPEEVRRERVALDAQLAGNEARRVRLARLRRDPTSDEPRVTGLPSALGVFAGDTVRDVLAAVRRHLGRTLVAVGAMAALVVVVIVVWAKLGSAAAAIVALVPAAGSIWKYAPKIISTACAWVARRTAQLDRDIRRDEARLCQLDAARQLGDCLTELRTPDRYADYRGLLGRVHNDLRELADSLTAARRQWVESGSTGLPPLQRIVLYVDDLDRCPQAKVIDVLRAVHLLLALPLFVVIVAVDPRWLRRAVEQEHARLFRPDEHSGDDDKEWRVSPTDYLDKIFQVPFALRPIGARAGPYIRSLLPDAASTATPASAARPRLAGPVGRDREGGPDRTTVNTVTRSSSQGPDGGRTSADPSRVSREFDDLRPGGLRITAAERAFLARVGPLLSTPRAAKRLVNLYRILRIGVPHAVLDDFVGAPGDGGPYQAAALLLASVVGSPEDGRQLLLALRGARPGEEITEFLRSTGHHRLAELIESIDRHAPVHRDVETFRIWAPTVARFSFATYDLFLDSEDVTSGHDADATGPNRSLQADGDHP